MRIKITESQNKLIQEKLMLKNWDEYCALVATAYDEAPDYEPSAVQHWVALNKSNYEWFKKITHNVNLIFVSGDKKYENNPSSIDIAGKQYPLQYYPGGQPYNTQPEMKKDYDKNHRLYISIDYSEHPYFSVTDNIVFRTVHDLLIHIKGNYSFETGELNSYNAHARLAPPSAVPALFTEVVGQAATVIVRGEFPKQKIAVLKGFDYYRVGEVDDYEIQNKELVPKNKELEPEMELNENIMKTKKIKITEAQLHKLLESELSEDNIVETVDPNQEGDVVIPNNNANTQTIKNYTDNGINVKLVDNNGQPTA